MEGKDISDDEDEDENWEENEDEGDELPLTEADKQSPILIVKSTLDLINISFNFEALSPKIAKIL